MFHYVSDFMRKKTSVNFFRKEGKEERQESVSPGTSSLVHLAFEMLQCELSSTLHQQLNGQVGDDVLEEGLVGRHLGLLHHRHIGSDPGAENKL